MSEAAPKNKLLKTTLKLLKGAAPKKSRDRNRKWRHRKLLRQRKSFFRPYECEKGRKNSQRALVFTATLIYTRTHACRKKKKLYFFYSFLTYICVLGQIRKIDNPWRQSFWKNFGQNWIDIARVGWCSWLIQFVSDSIYLKNLKKI